MAVFLNAVSWIEELAVGGGGGECSPSVEMKFCEYFAKTKCKILQSAVINWKVNRQNILI